MRMKTPVQLTAAAVMSAERDNRRINHWTAAPNDNA